MFPNRYAAAQSWWLDMLSTLVGQRILWQIMAMGELGIIVFLIILYAGQVNKTIILPYINTIDPQGHVLWTGPAESYRVEDVWIINALQEWIQNVRERPGELTRPENVKILNHAWQTAFNRTNGQAKADLAVYIEAENPLKHPEKRMMVEVTPMLVHRLGQGNSYRVDWAEEWKEGGRLIRKSRWSGTFTVEIKLDQKPTINGQTKAVLRASTNELAPMGLYISTYKWGEELTGGSY